ncbi:AsmA-like C-terminal domain-containing protein [Devosia sp.]|uniref:AsmA-like C-terminal domain-containing protein n=1 Tax=Devosia sp. TaxID=1871048 RepID=UPI002F07DCD1
MRAVARVAAWVFGVPLTLLAVLYVILLITPIPLPFVNSQVRNLVLSSMPEGSELELGDMALALEAYAWPVIKFSPVVYTDAHSGAKIRMDALEVGFSPVRALIGQPGATIAIVAPHLQVNQDLFGPRLTSFEIVPDPNGGRPTVRVIEGTAAFPQVGISAHGVDVKGESPTAGPQMRSDNDWLIYNLEAAGAGIAAIMEQAELGRFSRLLVRGGTLDMNDALYGLFRTFNDITLDISPTADGKVVEGNFSADFGGTVMNGIVERLLSEDGREARLKASITNLDLASFLPFVDDPEAIMSLVGPSAVSIDVGFDAATNKVLDGIFHVDLTGTDLRIDDDYFPVATSIAEIKWEPAIGQFTMGETQVSIGESSGRTSGVFVLGLDELYGPTVGISMRASDVSIHSELGAPETPFSEMTFTGWSAPLYGAMGIDQFQASKLDGARLAGTGRVDMLRSGMGFDMTIAGEGITADDLKRLWPYFIATDSREWFVKNVVAGKIGASSMKYSFPVGTVAKKGENKPIPKNGMYIDITGVGVKIIPMEGMGPIAIDGETRLEVRDNQVTVAADGGTVMTAGGPIAVANAALVMGSERPDERLIEISGDLSGDIPALVAFARDKQPELLAKGGLPVDLDALGGDLSLTLVSTIVLDAQGQTKSLDYAVNGVVQDFASAEPLDSHTIANGQFSFVASQAGFRVAGGAVVDGIVADVVLEGKLEEGAPPPTVLLSSTLDAEDLKKMGFDVSEFIRGQVKFVARPMPDASIQMAVDLEKAEVTIKDLGISKAAGVPGALRAAVRQDGTVTELSQIDVSFGDVKLAGSLQYEEKEGLRSAEFSNFALSSGDQAQMSLTPINGGYQVRVRGEQLDLKPMFKRFFGLGGDSTGGPQATAFTQTIALDVELKRALGFYKTTAFNLDLDLVLRGADLQRASLQAQLGAERSVSVTTNPTPDGKVMSVAFNDLGTILRLLGVYPNIEGGQGSLVIDTVDERKLDVGRFVLRDFAIVDEDNVAQILGNHQESRQLIARQNKLTFRSGEVQFLRRKDRIEVTDAILSGDTVGGTARGFIYTDTRQYDLSGTYVPLFGLNNVFQKLPIFGPLLGGREGEGLLGVTFAIRGPLDNPDFKVNPMSALVPGAFRRIFEYRAREAPRVE